MTERAQNERRKAHPNRGQQLSSNTITMKDVAKLAGVSLGTVSNVLNKPHTVRPENQQRVMRAVEQLGFRSNMVARTLKTRASTDIGLVIPDISNPFYPELARGVEDAANEAGLTVLLCNGDRKGNKELAYIESLLAKNVRGIILAKPHISLEKLETISRQTSLVIIDVSAPEDANYSQIHVDDQSGVWAGMDYLYSFGHRNIAFINGLLESLSSQYRFKAYLDFLTQQQLPHRPGNICYGDFSWQSGYQAGLRLIGQDNPPTAIIAANDMMALGCINALKKSGLRVPEDISVIGFDNIAISECWVPALTTINQPKYEMGKISLSLLHAVWDEPKASHQIITLPTELIIRDSVARSKK